MAHFFSPDAALPQRNQSLNEAAFSRSDVLPRSYRPGGPFQKVGMPIPVQERFSIEDQLAPMRRVNQRERPLLEKKVEGLDLSYIDHEEFHDPVNHKTILGEAPSGTPRRRNFRSYTPEQAMELRYLQSSKLLTPKQEVHHFKKMNLQLALAANLLRDGISSASTNQLRTVLRLHSQASETRNVIILANVRMVPTIAKHFAHTFEQLIERISDGNQYLMIAVKEFDVSMENRFCTFANRVILNSFKSDVSKRGTIAKNIRVIDEETALDQATDQRIERLQEGLLTQKRRELIRELSKRLSLKEQYVLARRFFYDSSRCKKAPSYREIAKELKISHQSVAQTYASVMKKLGEYMKSFPGSEDLI